MAVLGATFAICTASQAVLRDGENAPLPAATCANLAWTTSAFAPTCDNL